MGCGRDEHLRRIAWQQPGQSLRLLQAKGRQRDGVVGHRHATDVGKALSVADKGDALAGYDASSLWLVVVLIVPTSTMASRRVDPVDAPQSIGVKWRKSADFGATSGRERAPRRSHSQGAASKTKAAHLHARPLSGNQQFALSPSGVPLAHRQGDELRRIPRLYPEQHRPLSAPSGRRAWRRALRRASKRAFRPRRE